MITLIWFVLAVLASPFKSKSRLEALGGFTIVTSGLSFRYAHEGIWLSRAIVQVSHNRRFATRSILRHDRPFVKMCYFH